MSDPGKWTAPEVMAGLDAIMEGRMKDPAAVKILDANIEQRIQYRRPGMADKRLTREQIDTVLEGMTGADLIEHIGDGSRGAKVAGDAFDAAAQRLGITNGVRAMELVGIADFAYLASQLQEVMSLDSPKVEPGATSRDSASTGK